MDGLHRRAHQLLRAALLGAGLIALALLVGCGTGGDEPAATTTTTALVIPIANDACLSCHTDFQKKTASEDAKTFSHSLHLSQRISCSTCHVQVGHAGMAIPDQKVCLECHGMQMPHPSDFGTSHGQTVKANGAEVCGRCHNLTQHCLECHGIQMPHPAQWTEKHGAIALPQMEVCTRCHEKSFCLQCHPVEMPHPKEWTRTHGFSVATKGSKMCTNCHKPELCVSCHGMAMPHPSDWGTQHAVVAKEKPGECELCHQQIDCDSCHQIHVTHGKGGGS